jgi:PPM family protein phosphatase
VSQQTIHHLRVVTRTHPGMRGKNNEDRFGVFTTTLHDARQSTLLLVADGIGGHRAGEVAAEIAVTEISQVVLQSNGDDAPRTLAEGIIQASQAIHKQAQTQKEQSGMGATCVCAWMIDDRLFSASVGDSRLYLLRHGSLQQLTTDHTWVREALDLGYITPQEAIGHPNLHVIRRYLGSAREVVPDLRLRLNPAESDQEAESNQGTQLVPGDRLLLCSDGLSDLVEDQEILAALLLQDMEAALDKLVDLANERGGHDNITIIAAEVPSHPAPETVKTPAWRRLALAGLIMLLALGMCGVLTWIAYLVLQVSNRMLGLG